MAFRLPSFNLVCNIGPNLSSGTAPRLTDVHCALIYGLRTNMESALPAGTIRAFQCMNLVLPALTDIRGPQDSTVLADQVECPAGSGRYYNVVFVDDIGKGWANEHRTASMYAQPGSWTAPYP